MFSRAIFVFENFLNAVFRICRFKKPKPSVGGVARIYEKNTEKKHAARQHHELLLLVAARLSQHELLLQVAARHHHELLPLVAALYGSAPREAVHNQNPAAAPQAEKWEGFQAEPARLPHCGRRYSSNAPAAAPTQIGSSEDVDSSDGETEFVSPHEAQSRGS